MWEEEAYIYSTPVVHNNFPKNSGSHALFTGPTNIFFRKKNFKIGCHSTIHIFKNYFVTIFSVFNNKRYPNRPLKRFFIYILAFYFCFFSFYILFFTLCKYVSHNCSLLCFMRLKLGLKGFNLVTLDYISLKIYLLFIFFNYIFFWQ